MERLISWWAHNPVAANLLMVGILLAGVLGFVTMEREAFPLFKPDQVEVEVPWPGSAPQEVEEQIVMRIEEALTNLDNVYRVYSTASENLARVEVLAYAGVDIDRFLNDVKNVVDSVNSLPRDIENPQVRRTVYRNEMMRLAVHSDNLTERELTRLAQRLRDEVAALPYVSIVELFGVRKEEVSIELSEEAMRRYRLSFDQVADAIRGTSVNLSAGQVRTETGDVLLRARNLADSEQDFAAIIVRQSEDGGMVRLRDVARVVDGFEDEEILATLNGQPAVLLQIMNSDNMQVVKASDAVKAWMQQRQVTLPRGVELSMWFDSADIYKSRMGTIGKSAYLGLFLVFMVLILSLRPQVALWVTAGIGVAFIGTFSLLPANGVSLNIMSTFAFLLVLGIIVDDAIVVGESIHQHSSGAGGVESAVAGAYAVSKPVIFAVLTTILAFAPWFFVSLAEAQITRQFSIVITVALIISLIEAFLILPAHLRHLRHRQSLGPFMRRQKRFEEGILSFANVTYRRWLEAALARRYLTASLFISGFVISLGVFSSGWVKFSFFPEIQNDVVYIQAQLPSGTPFARSLAILDQLQVAERKLIDEVNERAEVGAGTGQLIESWYTRSRRDSVVAIIKLSQPEVRDMSAKQVVVRLRELIGEIPDADEIEMGYTFDNSTPGVSYVLRHRDLDILAQASSALRAQLYQYQGTYFVRDNLRGESDELHLNLLPGAQKLGITLAEVSRQLRQAYYGEEVQRLPRENGDVKVMVKYPKALRENLHSLRNFRIRTRDGREVPFLSVVEVAVASGVQRIQRQDGERMVQITADVSSELVSDIAQDMTDNFLPGLGEQFPGLVILKGGEEESQEFFLGEVLALYAVALFAMYALIAVAFRSYWLPLLIMTAIPFGFMGAVYGHLIFGVSMAMFSYFGIGAAAGVVVNDNLVLVDYIGRLRDAGKTGAEAVVEAGVHRFRPILLTTVTTFVGLLPIMAERSIDAEFLKPAVLALAFGVLFALLVTLFMVPALYCIGEDIRRISGAARIRMPGRAKAPTSV